ncbi:high affinity immunoglobulin epsilon receptor subunit gamma [Aplochiton taeniatus]
MKMRGLYLSALPLWMSFGSVEAYGEPVVCYILDSILFLYGLVLTILYCRLKKAEEGIYTGLTPHAQDTYETIGQKKGTK